MLIYLQMIDTPEEKSKFEEIYLEYRNLMFYVANQILHNEQDAEDTVHQAFVKIAENIEKIEEAVSPKTKNYVAIIAENQAIDLYRKKKRQTVVELNDEVAGIATEYDGDNTLVRCILKLSGKYRQVILLKYYHGYSVEEISVMLGISKTNATKLTQRAKKKLYDLCREEGMI